MPSPAFTLSVPADEPYRGLVAESVRVYLRASGAGVSPGGDAFVARVTDAVNRLSAGRANIEVVVATQPAQLDVQLTCGGHAETLTYPLAAAGG